MNDDQAMFETIMDDMRALTIERDDLRAELLDTQDAWNDTRSNLFKAEAELLMVRADLKAMFARYNDACTKMYNLEDHLHTCEDGCNKFCGVMDRMLVNL